MVLELPRNFTEERVRERRAVSMMLFHVHQNMQILVNLLILIGW